MKRTSVLATAAVGAVLSLGAVGVGTAVMPAVAGAQTDAAAVQGDASAADSGRRVGHPRLRQLLRDEAKIAAEAIGIPPEELREGVRSGSSIAEVAEANGVDPQVVIDAVVADLEARLDTAVAEDRISQERADEISERLPTRVENLVNRHRPTGG